uniref:Uncharacterized protein n=1 Tax=Arundo donax TaxID=35708 RepID=A0A0A9EC67_ARUDO
MKLSAEANTQAGGITLVARSKCAPIGKKTDISIPEQLIYHGTHRFAARKQHVVCQMG